MVTKLATAFALNNNDTWPYYITGYLTQALIYNYYLSKYSHTDIYRHTPLDTLTHTHSHIHSYVCW